MRLKEVWEDSVFLCMVLGLLWQGSVHLSFTPFSSNTLSFLPSWVKTVPIQQVEDSRPFLLFPQSVR